MSLVKHVTTSEFRNEVLLASTPVVLDFYATWCPPCKMLAPILDQLATEYSGRVKFVKVNTDEEQELATQFGIQGVPTLMFFEQGKLVDKVVGVPPLPTFRQKIDQLVAKSQRASA